MIRLPRTVGLLSLMLLLAACNGQQEEKVRRLGVVDDCDAAVATCHVSDDDISLSFSVGPGVLPLKPFPLTLSIKGGAVDAQSVVVDFQMEDMDMGINRYRLQPQQESWHGTATLPVCIASTTRMEWLAIIDFKLDGEPLQAVFKFYTVTN